MHLSAGFQHNSMRTRMKHRESVSRIIKTGSVASLLILSVPCWASVSGKVLHKDKPLEGCVVSLGQSESLTEAGGGFDLPSADGSLQIKCDGFAPKIIKTPATGTTLGEIKLKRPNFILIVSDDHGWVQTSTQMDPDDPDTKSD